MTDGTEETNVSEQTDNSEAPAHERSSEVANEASQPSTEPELLICDKCGAPRGEDCSSCGNKVCKTEGCHSCGA